MAPLPPEPSSFLQLPIEVRMMIYERIPIDVKEHKLFKPSIFAHSPCELIFIDRTISTAVSATCRQVYDEAEDMIRAKVRDITLLPGRMMTSNRGACHFISGFLLAARWMRQNNQNTLDPQTCLHFIQKLSLGCDYQLLISIAQRWIRCGACSDHASDDPASLQRPPSIEIGLKDIPNNAQLWQLRTYVAHPEYPPLKGVHYDFRIISANLTAEEKILREAAKFQINSYMSSYLGTIDKLHLGTDVESDEFEHGWSAMQYYRGSPC